MIRRIFVVGSLLAIALAAHAQTDGTRHELWAGADYDPAIPAPESVIGHRLGERLTPSADIRHYFEALRAAAPERMVIGEYGLTWQGRQLVWAAISSPGNIARLDAIRAGSRALSDPRRTDAVRARALIANQPVIVWLAYSVHGDEVSPAEASMAVARHLLASRGDHRVATMLEDAVVILVPTQNPDGRDRFVATHEAARGLEIDLDELSAERDRTIWPSGRYNHYLFDLNRDWFALTQPETRGHSRLMLDWRPQVVVDAHEMGDTESTFFFPPEADPINPLLPEAQMRSHELFGRALGAMFDREGLDYFTREEFDAFYPGYGDNWSAYLGAVSMTYEQATASGLAARRRTGEILTLYDTLRSHFLVSLSTIETAAANRERLLWDFYGYRAAAVSEGRSKGTWVLPRSETDPGAVEHLVDLLALQGIEIARSDADFKACGRSYRAGTYLIDMAQPQSRLVQVLLDPSIKMSEPFVVEQERRRAKRMPVQMYDVTAWSLSETFNTPTVLCSRVSVVQTPLQRKQEMEAPVGIQPVAVAYVVPAGSQAVRFLTAALRTGLKVRSPEETFTLNGRRYGAGSLVLTRAGNPPDLPRRIAEASTMSRAEVVSVPDTWVTEGPSVGSEHTATFVAPRIALAWGEPTNPTSAGSIRHLIEREYGYPVTVIRTALLESADLSRFDVLIIPDGEGFDKELGTGGVDLLRAWVRRGGVLVGVGRAVDMMAHPKNKLLAARRERLADFEKEDGSTQKKQSGDEGARKRRAESEEDKSEEGEPDEKDDGAVLGTILHDEPAYAAARRPKKSPPDEVPGALARAVVDPDHWLGAGAAPTVNVMVTGPSIFEPLRLDKGVNVVRFAKANELLVAGHLWEENRQQLAFKPALMVQPEERGYLIAFTQDPTVRGFLRGMDVLFMNAVFRAPAHARRIRP